jgi:plastocyanin
MSRYQPTLVGLACCTVLTLAFAADATACESADKKPKIKVSVENGQPVVDRDPLRVCVGDEVHWVFAGSDAKEFKVQFSSVTDSPFDWAEKNGSSVEGTVKADAVKDGKATPYVYDVKLDGATLDPKIIVDP